MNDPTPIETLMTGLNTSISGMADSISTALATNLPVVIAVGSAILAVGVVWRFAKRFVRG